MVIEEKVDPIREEARRGRELLQQLVAPGQGY